MADTGLVEEAFLISELVIDADAPAEWAEAVSTDGPWDSSGTSRHINRHKRETVGRAHTQVSDPHKPIVAGHGGWLVSSGTAQGRMPPRPA